MFCRHCGRRIEDDSTFCRYCGKEVSEIPEDPFPSVQPANSETTSPKEDDAEWKSPYLTGVPTSKEFFSSLEKDKPKPSPSRPSGCLMGLFIALALAVVVGTDLIPFDDVALPKENSVENQETEIKDPKRKFLNDNWSSILGCTKSYIKKNLANPDTASISCGVVGSSVDNCKITVTGKVTYTNASGEKLTEPFESCVLISEDHYGGIYLKLGEDIVEDNRDICNSLGVVTATGQSRFSDLVQGTMLIGSHDEPLIGCWIPEEMVMTLSEYQKIETGMTYDEVSEIVGSYGNEQARSNVAGIETVIISWEGNGVPGSNANVTFQYGNVISKAQVGLQ